MRYIKLVSGIAEAVICVVGLLLLDNQLTIFHVAEMFGAWIIPPIIIVAALLIGLIVCSLVMIITYNLKTNGSNYALLFANEFVVCADIIFSYRISNGITIFDRFILEEELRRSASIFDYIFSFCIFNFLIGVLGLVECWMSDRKTKAKIYA